MADAAALDLAKHVLLRRGDTAAINGYAGAMGEAVVDTTKHTLVLVSGTAGTNYPLAQEARTVTAGAGVTLTVDGSSVASATLAKDFTVSVSLDDVLAPAGTKGQLLDTDDDGKLKANLDLAYDASTGKLQILAADGETVYDEVVIPNAVTALESVELVTATAGAPVTVAEGDSRTTGTFIKFIYKLADNTNKTIFVDVTTLVDVYTAGDGLSLTGNKFSAKLGKGLKFDSDKAIAVDVKAGEGILKQDATDGSLYVDTNALNAAVNEVTVVSEDTGNVVKAGTDGGALVKLASGNNMIMVNDDGELYVPLDMGVIS